MIVTLVILVSGLNLSSMCKPSPSEEIDTSVRIFGNTETTDESEETIELAKEVVVSEAQILEEAPELTALDEDLEELTWRTLSDVEFKDVYIEELDAYYWKPTFGPSVKAAEGKEVFITGYVIPVDYDADFYVLSRYPFANCYFCGGAGPESVVDLRFPAKTRAYKTDERLTFKGKLRLNADDVYQMNYILEGAVEKD